MFFWGGCSEIVDSSEIYEIIQVWLRFAQRFLIFFGFFLDMIDVASGDVQRL